MSSMDFAGRAFEATSGGRALEVAGSLPVINPATGQVFAHAPAVLPAQLDTVFSAAERAFLRWRVDEDARRQAMFAAADALDAAVSDIAPVLTAEQGKPLKDAEWELRYAIGWLRYFAELEVPREVVRDDGGGYEEVIHRPVGVVAAITPWNYPVSLAMWKIAPALRAGSTMVLKPSPYTPLATLEVARALRGVLPDGVLNVVSGPDPLGAALVSHRTPRKISFTGSTAVGMKVAEAAASDLKRVTLELGGNDPAIVLDDVDVSAMAESLFWGAFTNNGQICLAVKRIYAHEDVKDELVDALGAIARSVRVGDGMEEGTVLGPVNNAPQFSRVRELVDDAVASGARVVAGGDALDRDGYFFAPTVLDGISDGTRIVDEEQFGPVIPVVSFRDEADALARANRGDFGLTASVWSSDIERAVRAGSQIESGQVSVNGHGRGVQKHLPFGGRKWSGLGVENGIWGLRSFTEPQVLATPARGTSEERK